MSDDWNTEVSYAPSCYACGHSAAGAYLQIALTERRRGRTTERTVYACPTCWAAYWRQEAHRARRP